MRISTIVEKSLPPLFGKRGDVFLEGHGFPCRREALETLDVAFVRAKSTRE